MADDINITSDEPVVTFGSASTTLTFSEGETIGVGINEPELLALPIELPQAHRQIPTDYAADSHQHRVFPVVGVIRWLSSSTFNFNSYKGQSINTQNDIDKVLSEATQKQIYFLDKFLTAGTVTTAKANHIQNMMLSLKDAKNEVMKNIFPDDWIFCCVASDSQTADQIRLAASQGLPINRKEWGLKFIGKIDTVSKNVYRNPDGSKGRDISIISYAFKELSSKLYYDPYYLEKNDHDNLSFLARTADSASVIQNTRNIDLFKIDNYIPIVFRVFLGRGPGASEIEKVNIGEAPKTFNNSFIIPSKVGGLMASKQSGFGYVYTDMVKYLGGGQHYNAQSSIPDLLTVTQSIGANAGGLVDNVLSPNNIEIGNTSGNVDDFIIRTTIPLEGVRDSNYLNPMAETPIWGITSANLNNPVNEMYTTLRVGPDGRIQPFIVARQVPFATPFVVNLFKKELPITGFYELPRWVIPDTLVTNLQVGRSTATRTNYVEVLATSNHTQQLDQAQEQSQKAAFPASVDFINIKTNGLIPLVTRTQVVSESLGETSSAAFRWTRLMSDRTMAGHLRYSGTIATKGIYEPICIGDNLEFGSILYHIENVMHKFTMNPDGSVSFTTTMSLSNGLNIPSSGQLESVNDLWPEFDETNTTPDGGPMGSNEGVGNEHIEGTLAQSLSDLADKLNG
jgi:hypothetical protein